MGRSAVAAAPSVASSRSVLDADLELLALLLAELQLGQLRELGRLVDELVDGDLVRHTGEVAADTARSRRGANVVAIRADVGEHVYRRSARGRWGRKHEMWRQVYARGLERAAIERALALRPAAAPAAGAAAA